MDFKETLIELQTLDGKPANPTSEEVKKIQAFLKPFDYEIVLTCVHFDKRWK